MRTISLHLIDFPGWSDCTYVSLMEIDPQFFIHFFCFSLPAYEQFLVAVSHSSGLLYAVQLEVCSPDGVRSEACDDSSNNGPIGEVVSLQQAKQYLLAQGSHSHAPSLPRHTNSIGLQLYSHQLRRASEAPSTSTEASLFRLVTYELDGSVAIWKLSPPQLVRTFRAVRASVVDSPVVVCV